MGIPSAIPTKAYTATTSENTIQPPNSFKCPKNWELTPNKLYSDVDNCVKYFSCTSDGVVHHTCDVLLERFDVILGTCVKKDLVSCFTCPENWSSNKKPLYQDPERPNWFYKCSSLGLFHWQCANNGQFDALTQTCVQRKGVVTEPSKATDSTSLICPKNWEEFPNELFSDVNNCTKYFRCIASGPKSYDCPPNQRFNPSTGKCVPENDVACFVCPKGWEREENPYYPDPENCDYFYKCSADRGIDHWKCADNGRFDALSRTCAEPTADQAPCSSRAPTSTTSTPTKTVAISIISTPTKTDAKTPATVTVTETKTATTTTVVEATPTGPFVCPEGWEDLPEDKARYEDKTNCHMFYQCEKSGMKHYTCADGGIFFPGSKVCVPSLLYPCNTDSTK